MDNFKIKYNWIHLPVAGTSSTIKRSQSFRISSVRSDPPIQLLQVPFGMGLAAKHTTTILLKGHFPHSWEDINCSHKLQEFIKNFPLMCSVAFKLQAVSKNYIGSVNYMSPVKRICVFEHTAMTNFNCACPAIQRGQGSGFLSKGSSWLTACMSEQRRFWRDCADAQARLNLRCSHRR